MLITVFSERSFSLLDFYLFFSPPPPSHHPSIHPSRSLEERSGNTSFHIIDWKPPSVSTFFLVTVFSSGVFWTPLPLPVLFEPVGLYDLCLAFAGFFSLLFEVSDNKSTLDPTSLSNWLALLQQFFFCPSLSLPIHIFYTLSYVICFFFLTFLLLPLLLVFPSRLS